MKTRITLILLVCCLLSVYVYAAEGDMLDKLTTHEKSLWEAIKNKNMDAFSAATAPEILEIDPFGTVMDKKQLIEEFNTFTITDYTLSDFKTFMLDKGAVVLCYSADTKGTMEGKAMEMRVTHTTTYVLKGGKWWPKFHTETPVVAPPATQTQ